MNDHIELYNILNLMERIDPQYRRYASILNEDRRGKAAKKACYSVLRQHFNNAEWLDHEYKVANNPHNLSVIDYIYNQFMDKFYHEDSYQNGAIMRLAPLFLRLALEAGYEQGHENTERMNRLQSIENYLHQANKTQGMDLKGISLDTTYEELNNAFGEAVDKEEALKKERIENGEYEDNNNNNGYKIVGPLTYEQAHEYGNQSCPDGKLCYTQREGTWDQYTAQGMNDAYVLLRDGWESIPAEHDDNGMDGYNGYDRYGLSMIFIFVNGDGKIAYCNTRWNHNADYKPGRSVDHALDEEDISKLIGKSFYKVFNGNDRWQKAVDDVRERLRNGEDPKNIFSRVWENGRPGFFLVQLQTKYNFINSNNELMMDTWYDDIFEFTDGFALVILNNQSNFIGEDFKLLSDVWFDWAEPFYDMHLARVSKNGKNNFLKKNGEFLLKEWYKCVGEFINGFAAVGYTDHWNFVDTEGNLISKVWFENGHDFSEGFAKVSIDGKWNFIDGKGRFLSDEWFEEVCNFINGFAVVKLKGKYNFIDKNGEILSENWFERVRSFKGGFACVRNNDKWNHIDRRGEFLSDIWFDEVESFANSDDDVTRVLLKGKWNIINTKGKLMSGVWFDYMGKFYGRFAKVYVHGKYNFIRRDGSFLSKVWFDDIYGNRFRVRGERILALLNGREVFLDINGNIHEDV